MQAEGHPVIEVGLPVVVHEMPSAAEGNREHVLLDQGFGHVQEKIIAGIDVLRCLVPVPDAVAGGIRPDPGVVVVGELIPVLFHALLLVFVHEVERHQTGKRQVCVSGIAVERAALHPPGKPEGLAVGINIAVTESGLHYPCRVTVGRAEQVEIGVPVIGRFGGYMDARR